MIGFYHNKNIDLLKIGCILPILANMLLHMSTDGNIHQFTGGDKDVLQKIREYAVGVPYIVFLRKAVVDILFIQKSADLWKSVVGIDASQLFPNSVCPPLPTGLDTHCDLDTENSSYTAEEQDPQV